MANTAIVTGGARGIGRAIARRLAGQGDKVYILDCSDEAGRETTEQMQSEGLDATFIHCDVGVAEDVMRAVARVEAEGGRLDWVVNNAGLSSFRAIDDLSVTEFKHILDVNLTAAFLFAKFTSHLLRQSPCGAIVNIASTRALMSESGNEAYAASKAGLLGLTHALANSLGPQVRVNAICPGWIDVRTDGEPLRPEDHAQHPVGRVGRPEDIANLTAYLLSPDSSFITGQSFVVDGGMTKKMIYAE